MYKQDCFYVNLALQFALNLLMTKIFVNTSM